MRWLLVLSILLAGCAVEPEPGEGERPEGDDGGSDPDDGSGSGTGSGGGQGIAVGEPHPGMFQFGDIAYSFMDWNVSLDGWSFQSTASSGSSDLLQSFKMGEKAELIVHQQGTHSLPDAQLVRYHVTVDEDGAVETWVFA